MMHQEVLSVPAILIGQTPLAAQAHIGAASILLVNAKDWMPLRIQGSLPTAAPLSAGTLTYQGDRQYEHTIKLKRFAPAGPAKSIGAEAISQRAGKSPLGAALLANALSAPAGRAALEALRDELGDEGYAWGLRIFGHINDLTACANTSADCLYELVAWNIEEEHWPIAAELLVKQGERFDKLAAAIHDARDYHCAPVKATRLSWAALLNIALIEKPGQGGVKKKAESERRELLRRAPRYSESIAERYYEGFAPLDHQLFKHDRPRVLYQRATERRAPQP